MVDLNALYASLVFILGFQQALSVVDLHMPVLLACTLPFVNSNRFICHFHSSCAENACSPTVWGTPVLRGSGFEHLFVWMSLVLYSYGGKVQWPVRAPSAQHDNNLISLRF